MTFGVKRSGNCSAGMTGSARERTEKPQNFLSEDEELLKRVSARQREDSNVHIPSTTVRKKSWKDARLASEAAEGVEGKYVSKTVFHTKCNCGFHDPVEVESLLPSSSSVISES